MTTANLAEVLTNDQSSPSESHFPGPEHRHGVHLNFDRCLVAVDGRLIRLTRLEFSLLHHLIVNSPRVVFYEELTENVLQRAYVPESALLRVHLLKLRRKLNPWSRVVKTVRGRGLWFDEGGVTARARDAIRATQR